MPDNGLVTVSGNRGTKETVDRLEADVKAKGMTIFARIDHAAGAKAVAEWHGIAMRDRAGVNAMAAALAALTKDAADA
jgi:hypothetical protein